MPTVTVEDNNHFPAHLIYDPANTIGVDANTSNTAAAVRIVQIDSCVAGTDFQIQGKVHKDADWVTVTTITGATDNSQSYTFDPRYNFVRVVRSAGSANCVAYVQS